MPATVATAVAAASTQQALHQDQTLSAVHMAVASGSAKQQQPLQGKAQEPEGNSGNRPSSVTTATGEGDVPASSYPAPIQRPQG